MADTSNNRKALQIELTGTTEGLGITTISGHNPNKPGEGSGIYIKDILTGRLAHKNGLLKIGDQLLQANDESLVGISNERAVEILRFCAATDSISLLIARDEIAQAEYQRLSIPNKEQSDYQPVKRSRHSTVKIGDHLYMWGGVGSRVHYDVMEMYHLPTGAWDQKPTTGTPPPGTWDYSSVAIGKDIYYFGGFGNGFHNNVHCINVDSFNWRELSPSSSDHSPMMKANCAMVLAHFDGEDYLIIFGGSRGSYSINTPKQPDAQYSADGRCNEIHYYRILSDQWISPVVTGDRPPPISHFTLTLVTNNTAVMFGGSTYNGANNKLYMISFTKTSVLS
ncbi:PREDICTED: kelch domain-containing protein 4-like [Amphimedon queenslandica]|uniref:PDZ domain-containing protein n=1 Tax=Amphimedon queenslandica TaxID=400682 RepID=A0AAN0JB38_AMPQE|nr:PREDICTED: kelch domain-containing protein 4-like [Amphimedon queenslandica]|eukprot:XP_019854235.1 PREDICTED: kelch domain-containing protein 4-like [Amphimedon queenslandica]